MSERWASSSRKVARKLKQACTSSRLTDSVINYEAHFVKAGPCSTRYFSQWSSQQHDHDGPGSASWADNVLRRTYRLLNPATQLSVKNTAIWTEAQDLLEGWSNDFYQSRSDGSKHASPLERAEYCVRILDRIASLLPQGELLFASLYETEVLNRILFLWRNGISDTSESISDKKMEKRLRRSMTPSKMAEKVDTYRFAALIQPDCKTFNILLDTASSFPGQEGIFFADALLSKLVQVTQDGKTPAPLVDSVSIGFVINGWVGCRNPERADAWLRRVQAWQKDGDDAHNNLLTEVKPNNIIYTSVISGWAKVGNAERAKEILQEQLDDYQHGNIAARPDKTTFNAVLDAFSKSNNVKTRAEADRIVFQMKEYTKDLGWNCYPDDFTWASLLACHAQFSPKQAERLLLTLEEEGESSSLVAYNTVLKGYANLSQAEPAAKLLQQMELSSSMQPDEISYNTVLSSWAKCKKPGAAFQAEALLNHMQDHGVSPTVISFSSVLQAWAKSNQEQAAERVEQWIREMQKDPRTRPNIICYNIALTAWGNHARLFRDRKAVERAVRLLDELLRTDQIGLKPSEATFRAVLNAVAGSTILNKGERAEALVELMERHGFRPNSRDRKLLQRLCK